MYSKYRLNIHLHCKKSLAIFPSPAGMSLTKLSLAGNNLIIPGHGECWVSDTPVGDGKIANLFLQCNDLVLLRKQGAGGGGGGSRAPRGGGSGFGGGAGRGGSCYN